MSAQREFNPTNLSQEDIKLISFQIAAYLKEGIQEIPLTGKQAYLKMGIGKTKFYRMIRDGVFKGHRPTPDSDEFFYLSEINSGIKSKE